ncbi:MAG: sulfatase-like hydrolase/transferase [Polyangiaceae bacterium]|nr:sulfatase-like hydrolase/transferase [Polyangiaceae bacterium]
MKRPPLPLALACSVSLAFGCKEKTPTAEATHPTGSAPAASSAPAEPEPPKPPEIARPFNVILLMIDSLRADMPWAGYERDILPHLTAYAKESCTVYENGYSFSSYTAKSVVPALVGEYPSAMKRDGYFFTRYPDADNLFLSERAQKEGHRTLAGHAHGYFLPALGNNQGFDDYRLIPGGVDLRAVTSITSEPLTKLAIDMLSDEKNVKLPEGKRFFAYYHYMDPHHTYEKHKGHPDFGNKARDIYDNEVHYTDKWVNELLTFARKQAWWKDTAVVITADHGEGFGERGQFRHAYELWEAVVKVPMVFCVPGAAPQHVRDVRRGHIDLAPTLADLMALPPEPPFRGESLVPEIFGLKKPEPKRIIVDLPRADLMDRRRAVIADDWKIVAFGDDRSFMLFNLKDDPWEKTDLAKDQPEKLEEMKKIYLEESAKIPNVEVVGGPPLKGAPPGRRW